MNNCVKIYGRLTNFDGNPIYDGDVVIKDGAFNNIYMTKTDIHGNYCLEVQEGIYMAIYAVKDYGINNLEYWGWNLPAFEDTEINMSIDGLEVYAINAFMIQRTQPTMMLYFRPMSLSRGLKLKENPCVNNENLVNISPNLNRNNIEVKVNEELVSILEVNKVIESIRDGSQALFAYLVQISIPDKVQQDYSKIQIILTDDETGEKGEGSLFWQKPKSFSMIGR